MMVCITDTCIFIINKSYSIKLGTCRVRLRWNIAPVSILSFIRDFTLSLSLFKQPKDRRT